MILITDRCGKGNEEGLECLQRRGDRIVLNTAHLSTERWLQVLVGTSLREEEKTALLNWLKRASRERPQIIFKITFNLNDMIFMIMILRIRTN